MPETRGLCLSEEQTISSVRALLTFYSLYQLFLMRNESDFSFFFFFFSFGILKLDT